MDEVKGVGHIAASGMLTVQEERQKRIIRKKKAEKSEAKAETSENDRRTENKTDAGLDRYA